MDDLTPADAGGLRDLADRSRRAAGTARQAAAGSEVSGLLTGMAGHLEAAAAAADQIADVIERAVRDRPAVPLVAVPLTCGHEAGVPQDEVKTILFWCATCNRLRTAKDASDAQD